MEIKHILAFVSIALFSGYFFLNKFPRKAYLLFLLVLLPFIDLKITPEEYGSISVFDFISYFVLFFTLDDFFNFSRKNNVYYFLFCVLTGILFIGCIKSEYIENSLFNFFKYLSIFIYSKMLIDECLKDTSFVKLVIKSLKLSCLFSLVFLSIQLIIGPNFTFYTEIHPNIYLGLENDTFRYPSYFQDPQKYAQYLSMISFIFLMSRETKPTPGILNVAVYILVVLAILLTGSRAAFGGLFIGLLIILLSKKGKIWIIAVFCCLIGYFIITNFSEYFSLFNRSEDFNTSFETRDQIWKENLQIFFANPFIGIGIGNHHNYVVNHNDAGYYLIDNAKVYYGTESGYLKILIEFGLLGFIFVFFLILMPVINATKSYINSHNVNIIFLIASVISWLVALTTENSIDDIRVLVVLVTFLCLLIVSKKSPNSIHA